MLVRNSWLLSEKVNKASPVNVNIGTATTRCHMVPQRFYDKFMFMVRQITYYRHGALVLVCVNMSRSVERDTYLMFGFALFIIISHCGQYCSVRKCFMMQL